MSENRLKIQVEGALDNMTARLKLVGLQLFRRRKGWRAFTRRLNIPIMEKVFKHRFKGKYPARKTFQRNLRTLAAMLGARRAREEYKSYS